MTIPGAKNIDVSSIIPVKANNEVFCFRVESYATKEYLQDFIEQLNDHLPSFVFSTDTLKDLRKQLKEKKTKKTPLDRARKLLQRTAKGRTFDSGEFTEFLLYLFAKNVKGAHKLVSKVYSRGSTSMTIPGSDSTFAFKDMDGSIYMLLGEAKAKVDGNDALREGQTDINAFWNSNKVEHEILLASTHLKSEMTKANADLYEAYFIDDNPKHKKLKYRNVIFVACSFTPFTELIKSKLTYKEFEKKIAAELKRCFINQKQLIAASKHPCIFCFFPFECIDKVRDLFANHHSLIYKK